MSLAEHSKFSHGRSQKEIMVNGTVGRGQMHDIEGR
jgi:hypothetical protein